MKEREFARLRERVSGGVGVELPAHGEEVFLDGREDLFATHLMRAVVELDSTPEPRADMGQLESLLAGDVEVGDSHQDHGVPRSHVTERAVERFHDRSVVHHALSFIS